MKGGGGRGEKTVAFLLTEVVQTLASRTASVIVNNWFRPVLKTRLNCFCYCVLVIFLQMAMMLGRHNSIDWRLTVILIELF